MGYFDDDYEEQEGLDQEVDLDEEEIDEEEEECEEDEDTIQELQVDERGRPRIRHDYYDGDLD
jgi:hypothetical protein